MLDPAEFYELAERAVQLALAKKYGVNDLEVHFDRDSDEWKCNRAIDMRAEGRVIAQAVKQAIIGRGRSVERDALYDEYESRIGEIVHGTVQRFEGDARLVDLGSHFVAAILPGTEKAHCETFNVGDRIRCVVQEVTVVGSRVKVVLSPAI